MQGYIFRRILLAAFSTLGLSILVFVLLRVVPGDAASILLGEGGSATPEEVEALRRELGLHRSIPEQYALWFGQAIRGDLGTSIFTGRPVLHEIWTRVPVTIELALWAMLFAVVVAVPVGILSALHQDTAVDQGLRFLSMLGLAVPNFWVGTLVMVLGARWFGWIPPVGYSSPQEDLARNLQQFVLPGMIVGLAFAASLARMTRSALLEVLREDYVRTARSKGLRERTLVVRHALRNALIPVVTIFAIQLGVVVNGVVIIENIFNLPGLGRLILDAIQRRDYPLVQGIVLFLGIAIVAINLATDLVYAWLDPRIRYGR